MTLGERLVQELMRYGIYPSSSDPEALTAEDLDGLLRHIYANRDLVRAVKDKTIEILKDVPKQIQLGNLDASLDDINQSLISRWAVTRVPREERY